MVAMRLVLRTITRTVSPVMPLLSHSTTDSSQSVLPEKNYFRQTKYLMFPKQLYG